MVVVVSGEEARLPIDLHLDAHRERRLSGEMVDLQAVFSPIDSLTVLEPAIGLDDASIDIGSTIAAWIADHVGDLLQLPYLVTLALRQGEDAGVMIVVC